MKVLAPLAENGKINPNASIRDSQSTIINAPVDVVWKSITEIEKWPEWNDDIADVKFEELSIGSTFSWTMNGTSISSTIRQIKENEMISWTGKAMGMKAIHVWNLEETDGNQTIVTTDESLQGFFTLFFSHQKLHSTLLHWLDRLKQHAEKV
ncbi:SRPBCC family protein [Marinoscillum furvescens]|uniref:Polyketide cyclase/dehydrase/lipid transport protein n=1 Tax=Marinoscillum furvescens DSM 4134 TaxID=1122208 RepID=A0A3D9KYC9_MARFU|nr:SRPBCC family protein [Marinoscillum furvescens]RED94409.1 polyketide cyclase/dehydrase/lipid transport protein [Marinoscillum furvescens DSM 4134]